MAIRVSKADAARLGIGSSRTNAGARKPRRRNPESALVSQILAWLRLHDIFAWRNQSHPVPGRKFTGMRGVADIIGILSWRDMGMVPGSSGRLLGIEVKTEHGKTRPEQTEWMDQINSRGGLAFVARSLDDVIARLGE